MEKKNVIRKMSALLMMLAAVCVAVTAFTACSDDDDIDKGIRLELKGSEAKEAVERMKSLVLDNEGKPVFIPCKTTSGRYAMSVADELNAKELVKEMTGVEWDGNAQTVSYDAYGEVKISERIGNGVLYTVSFAVKGIPALMLELVSINYLKEENGFAQENYDEIFYCDYCGYSEFLHGYPRFALFDECARCAKKIEGSPEEFEAYYNSWLREFAITDRERQTVKVITSFLSSYNVIEDVPDTVMYNHGKKYTVTEVIERAFMNCVEMKIVTLPNTLTAISKEMFLSCWSLSTVAIPESVTSIGEGAFARCVDLTSIEIPESVTEIGPRAFTVCTSLQSISIPGKITEIKDRTFMNCTGLTSVSLPESLVKIGLRAFLECESLKSITIPANVQTIDDMAFAYCQMDSIVCLSINPPTAYNDSFDLSYEKATLVVPDGCADKYKEAAVWKKFKTIKEISKI